MSDILEEIVGVDIGGTNIKAGRISQGNIVSKKVVAVNPEETAAQTLDKLFAAIDGVITDEVKALGIGVPAVVDTQTGIAYDVQNIPSWKEVRLKEMVQQRYAIPVYVNNDANCFVIGEKLFGRAQGISNCIGLSIGTGLGMGIIINDQLYNGVLCGAGEIGMLSYRDSILEHYTGSFFFTKYYGSSAKSLYEKAQEGDRRSVLAFEDYGTHLGEAIKNILYAYAPKAIFLGGSISNAYPYFKTTMARNLASFAYPRQLEQTIIEVSQLKDSAIIGAAALWLHEKPI